MVLIDFFAKYGKAILITTTAIGAYVIAVKAQKLWTTLNTTAIATQTGAVKVLAVAKAVLTGKIKLATIAQRAWNIAMKANPLGLIIGLLTAAGVGLLAYKKKADKAKESQEGFNDELERTNELLGEQQYTEFLKKIGFIKQELVTLPDGTQSFVTVFDESINVLEKFGNSLRNLKETELENYKRFFEEELVSLERSVSENDNPLLASITQQKINDYKKSLELIKVELEKFAKIRKKVNEDDDEEIVTPKIDNEKEINRLILEARNELSKAKIESLKDGIEKELQIENQRWLTEKQSLESRLIKKQELSKQELELNSLLKQQIEEKEKQHLKRISELEKAEYVRKSIEKLELQKLEAETEQERHDAEIALLTEQFNQKYELAEGNRLRELQAELWLKDELAKIENEKLQNNINRFIAEKEIELARLGLFQQAFGTLRDLVGEQSKIGKALFLFQQSAAVAEVVFQTAIANAKALALSPLTFGQPWVGINTGAAVISIAGILGTTLKEFGAFFTGGYTGFDGAPTDVAGTVHKKEFVANAQATANPSVKGVLDIINLAQKNGSISRLDLPGAIYSMNASRGFAAGGYASTTTSAPSATVSQNTGSDFEKAAFYIYEAAKIFASKNLVITADAVKKIAEAGYDYEVQKASGSRV